MQDIQWNWQLVAEVVIFSLWLIKTLYGRLRRQGFHDIVHLEEEVKKKGDERCKQITTMFDADRAVYWAISNGEEFISGWSKKKLVALCEYYKKDTGLKSFRDAFLEVSTLRFNRNLKALLNSVGLIKDTDKEKISLNYGQPNADIIVYSGGIFVQDEAAFQDDVGEINMMYGFRSLAACKAYNSRGKLQGFLVIGWKDVKPENEVNMEHFKDQGKTFHRVIDQVMDKYRLRNKLLDKLF